jgi:RNA polymerase sigma factor (sigma-70 family)
VVRKSALRLQSDDRLVALAREGVAPAFDEMVERYQAPLNRYCARMVGREHAEDVVQETFASAYSVLLEDDRPLQLKPWLYRVAHNAAITTLRRKSWTWEELDESYDGVRQPPDHAEMNERLHDLMTHMRKLPERQRAAIVLQELEGRSPEEIARELDGSVPVVRQLVHRARERLRAGCGALIPLPFLLKLFNPSAAAAKSGAGAATAATAKSSAGAATAFSAAVPVSKGVVVAAISLVAGGSAIVSGAVPEITGAERAATQASWKRVAPARDVEQPEVPRHARSPRARATPDASAGEPVDRELHSGEPGEGEAPSPGDRGGRDRAVPGGATEPGGAPKHGDAAERGGKGGETGPSPPKGGGSTPSETGAGGGGGGSTPSEATPGGVSAPSEQPARGGSPAGGAGGGGRGEAGRGSGDWDDDHGGGDSEESDDDSGEDDHPGGSGRRGRHGGRPGSAGRGGHSERD